MTAITEYLAGRITCQCGRPFSLDSGQWLARMQPDSDQVAEVICPDCQTFPEQVEAFANQSALSWRKDAFGRFIPRRAETEIPPLKNPNGGE